MLPEQFHRLLERAEDEADDLRSSVFQYNLVPAHILEAVQMVRRLDWLIIRERQHPFYEKYREWGHPHTLTGDDWRRAWAEAQDRATDAALDAIY